MYQQFRYYIVGSIKGHDPVSVKIPNGAEPYAEVWACSFIRSGSTLYAVRSSRKDIDLDLCINSLCMSPIEFGELLESIGATREDFEMAGWRLWRISEQCVAASAKRFADAKARFEDSLKKNRNDG